MKHFWHRHVHRVGQRDRQVALASGALVAYSFLGRNSQRGKWRSRPSGWGPARLRLRPLARLLAAVHEGCDLVLLSSVFGQLIEMLHKSNLVSTDTVSCRFPSPIRPSYRRPNLLYGSFGLRCPWTRFSFQPQSDRRCIMNDGDIREALDFGLRRTFGTDPNILIRHEFGVESGQRRIDVAVLNGHLAGWEIKSDEDTLKRLPDQAESFARVMDYLTIVTTTKHLDRSSALLPATWGLVEAISGAGGVRLVRRRRPRINRQTDAFSLAQLLWREEVMDELRARGSASGLSGKSRYFVWERLVATTPKKELRELVLNRLKQRGEWSGGQLRTRDVDSFHR